MRNRLRVIRAEMNISQQRLSEMSGVPRVTIGLIETEAKNPSAETIIKLVRATGIPANKIFYDLDV